MMLPKVKNLYPQREDSNSKSKCDGRKILNRMTLQYWDDYTGTCREYGLDAEIDWKRQRNYLYDLYYRGRGYDRKRPILDDNRKHNGKKNHRKPKADLSFSKEWLSNANGNGGQSIN